MFLVDIGFRNLQGALQGQLWLNLATSQWQINRLLIRSEGPSIVGPRQN